ncbi:NifB/NifX family molybdenum-iron cluster-binding protein [Evtepia sp.]|uniref:NifB/NifX family molybdenum-iron cluster-binding protein n=1 Tax=Evtepia sp. TaxID=2773933 RepID=UPI00399AF6BC
MKLAITYDNGQVFQHFGKTEAFKIYDIAEGKVGPSMVMSTNGQGHGALAGLLRGLGISVLICGGIGPGAQDALANLDITVIPGITGDVDQAAQDFVDGKLVPNTEALCNHHHEGAAHNCGAHSCGTGGCHSH